MSKWLVLPTVAFLYIAAAASGAAPRDRDRDGLPDRWERRHHLSTGIANAKRDPDRDGLTNRRELRLRTHPRRADTDRDRLRDGAEVRRYKTNPRKQDTDRDGLRDGAEVRRYHTNPRKQDTDRDGFGDGVEVRAGTDPLDPRSHPSANAAPQPGGGSPGGFPNAASTGVPAGTTLTAYTGPSTISTPGTVISGKTMGCISVKAPGVVIRNSRILCANAAYLVSSRDGDYGGTALLVEDSEVACTTGGVGTSNPGTAFGEANITVRRVDIYGCENGFDVNQKITVEDSYIHDLYNGGDAHMDGIQFAIGHFVGGTVVDGVLNVTIRHNTIYGMGDDGSFGTSAIISNRSGADTNVLIENNLLAGGAVALYCEQDGTTGTNYRVIDNHFSRTFSASVGFYGVSTDCSDETQSGNVYHETGQPVRLP
jgi:hypothetical protein